MDDASTAGLTQFAALDVVPAFVVVTRDDAVVHINPTAARLLGVESAAAMRGQPLPALFAEDDAAKLSALSAGDGVVVAGCGATGGGSVGLGSASGVFR